jgi:hypothetical protein
VARIEAAHGPRGGSRYNPGNNAYLRMYYGNRR